MFGLQELLESTIEEMLASGDLDQYQNNELESSVADMWFNRRYGQSHFGED